MPRTKSFPAHFKAATDGSGEFEAIVAVFGNVDHQGDRVIEGAFANTLAEWKASGDPIPVIHSHQWHDLDAHIGEVLDAEELSPGDARLPDALKDLGGLWVKGRNDIEDSPTAARAHDLMVKRRLREFSFAYDVREDGSKRGDDGVNELTDLDIFEVGPTLKGANPATALIGAKGIVIPDEVFADIEAGHGKAVADALAAAVAGMFQEADAKARVTIGNSIEGHLAAIAGEIRAWAEDTFGADLYWTYVEATMADHVLAYVELWDDSLEDGTFYEVAYTADGDTIELGEARAVELEVITRPKSFDTLPRAKATPGTPITPAKADETEDDDETEEEEGTEIPSAADLRSMIASELESIDV